MLLKNHVILITGAGGGLGSTAARTLAKQGAHIILLDKSIPKLEKAYDSIVECGGVEPIIYPFDLAGASEAEYQEMAETIKNKYDSLQGLLHSAVELSAYTPIEQHGTMEWGHTLNVNLNAPFILSRVLLPLFQASEYASIVFTNDSMVTPPRAYSGAYGVSKIALHGFAKILAEELESTNKIRVNTLIPGPVNSPFHKKLFPSANQSDLPGMETLEKVYLYLFGSESIGTTGKEIHAQSFFH